MIRDEKFGWAIATGERNKIFDEGFIGIYWFDVNEKNEFRDGYKLAIFETRSLARTYLNKVKGSIPLGKYPKARVVRVCIFTCEIKSRKNGKTKTT